MAGNKGQRDYPIFRARRLPLIAPVGVGAILAGVAADTRGGGWSVLVDFGLLVLLVALLGSWAVRSRVSATITDPDGVTVRRLLGSQKTAWTDIRAIKVEAQPVWTVLGRETRQTAVIYDRDDRRVALVFLDEKHTMGAVHQHVRGLRRLWKIACAEA